MIVIDSNVLVALVDGRDDLHERASRDLMRAAKEPLATTSVVLGEVCFLLPSKHHRQRLAFLLERLSVAPLELEPSWWADVFAWLERYAEHEPDLADAQLAVLASKHRGVRVWSYDAEFQHTWRRANGARIPLFGRLQHGR